jgi:NitT/TauT family transport system substrate-binding protein
MFTPKKSVVALFSFLPLIALIVSACGTTNQQAPTNAPTKALTPMTIQLSWVNTIEFAGFQFAQEKGYYAEEGLSVQSVEGGFDKDDKFIDPIEQVVSGKANFGVVGIDRILSARMDGRPVVAISSIYQRSAGAIVSLAKSNIKTPEDLVGKTIALAGGPSTTYFYALLKQRGLDPKKMNIVERTDFTTAPLTSGKADAMDSFITNEPVSLKLDGQSVDTILYSDYGLDAYSNLIFTTEDMIKNKPDLVVRFLRATMRGYQTALNDVDQAAQFSVKYNPKLAVKAEAASMRASVPLLLPAANKRLGDMQPQVWELVYKLLRESGTLTKDFDLKQSFTLDFLDKANAQAKN